MDQWEFQDPIDGGTVSYVWPYFLGIFPYIGLIQALYMVGASNQSVPEMASDWIADLFFSEHTFLVEAFKYLWVCLKMLG